MLVLFSDKVVCDFSSFFCISMFCIFCFAIMILSGCVSERVGVSSCQILWWFGASFFRRSIEFACQLIFMFLLWLILHRIVASLDFVASLEVGE